MTLNEVQESIIEEFGLFGDWMDKYNYLIEISKELEPIDDQQKVPENLIRGCQSRVWLSADMNDGNIVFKADSDAIITKGIIALLIRVLSNRKPDEIMNADLYFIDQIGLRQNLSPTRSNGLLAMVKQMKMYGLAYHTKLSQQ
ncbi:MAG TPA: SufE family protein [Bacteroidales bacterium]|nr:SufE family protein [Bacteroidales bacterium]